MVRVKYLGRIISYCFTSGMRRVNLVKDMMISREKGKVVWFMFMVYNLTFNNISVISWLSVLFVEEAGVPGENHRPVASH